MIPVLEAGRWRNHFLWVSLCPRLSPAESHTWCTHTQSKHPCMHGSRPLLQLGGNPSPISQWSLSSTDWLKCYNSKRKCQVNLSTYWITLLHLLLLSYLHVILFRIQQELVNITKNNRLVNRTKITKRTLSAWKMSPRYQTKVIF